jgi:hypothetical protein
VGHRGALPSLRVLSGVLGRSSRAACSLHAPDPGAAWRWQWDTEEVDEEFAKKLQAEVEKMEADKAAKSPAPDAGAAAEGTE